MDEKEYAVINVISKNYNLDQRRLSKVLDFSLGMTNLLLKRLIKKGYIKVRMLDRKRMEYILTPKGFIEKARKTYSFLLNSINQLNQIKNKIQHLVLEEYKKGNKKFIILGKGELTELIRISIEEMKLKDVIISQYDGEKNFKLNNAVILNVSYPERKNQSLSSNFQKKVIDIYSIL